MKLSYTHQNIFPREPHSNSNINKIIGFVWIKIRFKINLEADFAKQASRIQKVPETIR